MPRTNVEALLIHQPKRPFSRPTEQPPPEASAPAKRPRDGHKAARAPKKGQRPARRGSASKPGGEPGEGDSGDGDSTESVASYARVRAEIEAVHRNEVRRITVNVPRAAILVLGALPKMLALRDAMRATLIDPPLAILDKLRDYALAAAYIHARILPHDEGGTRLRALLNEATPLRERLLSSAETLATFGLLDAREVAAVRRGSGHVDTAQDLSSLVGLFRDAGPAVVAKTPLTAADLARAGELGGLLLEALGQRQSGADGAGEPGEAEERLGQAYVLMARAYDTCRRVVSFLRWNEGDADLIAPPLGQSRRPARRPLVDEPGSDEPEGPDGPDADEPDDTDEPDADEPDDTANLGG